MKRRYSMVSLALALGVAVALLGALVMVRESNAITFAPTLTASVSDDTAGAAADLETVFAIPAGNAQFLAQATFTPPEFGVSAGTDLPLGAISHHIGSPDRPR